LPTGTLGPAEPRPGAGSAGSTPATPGARAIGVEDPDHGRSPSGAACRLYDVIPSSPAPSGRPPTDPRIGNALARRGDPNVGSSCMRSDDLHESRLRLQPTKLGAVWSIPWTG
jgi:hypothetical protein